jgi:hypothetical protein
MGVPFVVVILFHRYHALIIPPRNNTYDDELVTPVSLPEQYISM